MTDKGTMRLSVTPSQPQLDPTGTSQHRGRKKFGAFLVPPSTNQLMLPQLAGTLGRPT